MAFEKKADQKTAEKNDKSKTDGPQFNIHRVYVKKSSFEAQSINRFHDQEWKPTYELNLKTEHELIKDNTHEVIVTATLAAKMNDETAFTAVVEQAGMFTASNFDDEQLQQMLGSYCPSVLFPYVREALSDTVNRGGFPQVYLAPVNFEAIYRQKLAQEAKS